MVSKRFITRAVLVGALFAVAAWLFGLRSAQYQRASTVLGSQQFRAAAGEVRFTLPTAFRITHTEGRVSTVTYYVVGTREHGLVTVAVANTPQGTQVESVTFKGRQLPKSPESSASEPK
jgi:hypothetical protein